MVNILAKRRIAMFFCSTGKFEDIFLQTCEVAQCGFIHEPENNLTQFLDEAAKKDKKGTSRFLKQKTTSLAVFSSSPPPPAP